MNKPLTVKDLLKLCQDEKIAPKNKTIILG